MLAFRRLAQHSPDYETWECQLPELYRLELPGYLWGHPSTADGDFIFTKSDEHPSARRGHPSLVTTPLELMENAASLAEFEVFGQDAPKLDPSDFRRWRSVIPRIQSASITSRAF